VLLVQFTGNRKLDTGNPNPGNLGSDFNRLGFVFWDELNRASPRNAKRRQRLEQFNLWRNAIGHFDFSKPEFMGRTAVRMSEVATWRSACDGLAKQFDAVVARHLTTLTGVNPW
jgi:hypothetical protein